MDVFILQDWTTIQGSTTGGSVTQSADDWLDLGPYQDVSINVEVAVTTAATINVETAPARNNLLFTNLVSTESATAVQRFTFQVGDGASVVAGRWLRWRVGLGASNSLVTFRITVLAKPQGFH